MVVVGGSEDGGDDVDGKDGGRGGKGRKPKVGKGKRKDLTQRPQRKSAEVTEKKFKRGRCTVLGHNHGRRWIPNYESS